MVRAKKKVNKVYKKTQKKESNMPGKVLKEVLKLLPSGSNEAAFIRAWNMSELEMPAVLMEVCESSCGGCRVAGGLYLRCNKPLMSGSNWCKTCHANMVSDGRPKHGIFAERIGDENWRTDEGKAPITFMQYLKKKGMTRADGEEFLGDRASDLPDYEWKLPTRGRRGSAASDTSSEGGRGKYTSRYLPLDTYKGVSPSDVEHAHKGSNGKVLRVYKYTDGSVRKVNPNNWTEAAHAKFLEMYGGDGSNEGFEEAKKKRGKKHANDAALEQMDEMRAMLEKLTAERDAAQAALEAKSSSLQALRMQGVDEAALVEAKTKEADEAAEAKAKADKKAKLKAEKAKKKADKLAKKKADAAAALKKQQEELKRQQEELQKQMAAAETDEMSEEEDSDAFDSDEDSDEEEVVFNAYEHNGTLYHLDDETQELSTEDGDYFGYIDSDGEVHEGDKPEDE